jgi:ammonia channel protein AmtB
MIWAGVLATVCIVALIPTLSVFYREFLDGSRPWASALSTTAVSLTAAGTWMLTGSIMPGVPSSELFVPTAALAALAGFLATLTVRDNLLGLLPAVVFAFLWTAIVFSPVALLTFFPDAAGADPAASPTDHGGAILTHLTAGSALWAIALAERRHAHEDRTHIRPRSWLLYSCAIVMWILWTGSLVGLELAFDTETPRILLNCLIGPLTGLIAWLIVQRIMTAKTTAAGAAAGLVCGLVAVTPGCAVLDPLFAAVICGMAGVVCCIISVRRVRLSGRVVWFLVCCHLVAAAIGVVMLGPFDSTIGFIYTGQTQTGLTQLSTTALVVGWSTIVTLVLWPFARLVRRLVPQVTSTIGRDA